jgi:Flp pilus assembly protein TadG
MHTGLISRASAQSSKRRDERGVTIVLVALAMVAIISVAALSIDVITLYLAREEAQRTADAAALAAARVLSLSGVTGDPDNTQGGLPFPPWQTACNLATQVAQAVVKQNTIGRAGASSPTVTFLYNGTATSDCTAGGAFAINPQVKVDVVQQGLPTFFSRLWNRTQNQVSATATAEAFNPSFSLNDSPNGLVTVTPRCVKPWLVPNQDPRNSVPAPHAPFVVLGNGNIQNPGIQLAPGTGPGSIIGEKFALVADCLTGNPNCKHGSGNGLIEPPTANGQGAGTLDYVPALIGGTANGVPSCATGSAYQEAIAGCDQSTVYACGIVSGGTQADLSFNPGKTSGDTATATECRIHQNVGQDVLDSTQFPFQIQAGLGNPVITNAVVTSSNSIVTVPIYDDVATAATGAFVSGQASVPVNIVGFLQVFINGIDTTTGNINVTVLNVAGCSNTATTSTPTVSGSSPVPVRLITAP